MLLRTHQALDVISFISYAFYIVSCKKNTFLFVVFHCMQGDFFTHCVFIYILRVNILIKRNNLRINIDPYVKSLGGCCNNCFWKGIDKLNVRRIIHYGWPQVYSLDLM